MAELSKAKEELADQESRYELLKEKAQKKLHELKKSLDEKTALLASSEQGSNEAVENLKMTYEEREKELQERVSATEKELSEAKDSLAKLMEEKNALSQITMNCNRLT
ncbi:hypothetical protein EB796_012215 [Bugula neritina]|uniref:Uncharacterized protein n=1 Tax=Bugula neritina TaxID=10212 RepID=A0A7J7JW11_BUGNE|nr:hypothetical protein EB796_012215 [Bugula neritina]